MNIIFKDILIENFLSHKKTYIIFDKKYNFIVLSGENRNVLDNAKSNGSGKSAIFDALCWCLTGETVRGIKDVQNIFINEDAKVTLNFSVDDVEYRIIRTKGKQSNINFFVNGEDKSGKGVRDTQQIVEQYFPNLTAQFIGSVIILGQGMPMRFSNNTPSGRKEVLEKLSQSDYMIEDIKTKIANRKNFLSTKLREYEDEKLKSEISLQSIEKQIDDFSNKLKNIGDVAFLENQSQELQEDIIRVEKCAKTTQIDVEKCAISLNDKRKQYQDENAKEKDALHTCELNYINVAQNVNNKLAEYNNERKNIESEIKRLKSIVDICPTCGQKIQGVHKPSTEEQEKRLSTVKETIYTLNIELNNIKQKEQEERNVITESFRETKERIKSEGTLLLSQNDNIKKQYEEINKLLSDKKSKLAEINAKISSYNDNKLYFESKISELEKNKVDFSEKIVYNLHNINDTQNRLSVIKKFETATSRDFRGYLLTNVIDYINKKCKEYAEIICGSAINLKLDKNNLDIYYGEKVYESLSGGEKQKVDIVIQFAIRKMLCTFMDFESNIIVLDEIFDNCDSIVCDNIVKLITSKLSNIDNIYIISHHIEELQIPYDYEIKIVKGKDNISRIEV